MKFNCWVATIFILIAGICDFSKLGGMPASAQNSDPNMDGTEVLTRGPVHEAFAEPDDFDIDPGVAVTMEPPPSIEEFPPDEKPEGDNVQWIPGYWSWDAERDDFIWVSGIWRLLPPGRSWVPGYWSPIAKGWGWAPGFWSDDGSDEVEYLPEPPSSLEAGPSSPPPSTDHLWTPGCWIWVDSRYAWRPGFWVPARPDWVWEPTHYIRTPRGHVCVDGYWDRTLERRGLLFAPVYVRRVVYARPNYVYSPVIVIQPEILVTHLFISRNHGHYLFGDYYGEEYSRRGVRPWFEPERKHRGYDPIYTHYKWKHGKADTNWEERLHQDYDFRRKHADARPARTYSKQASLVAHAPERERRNMVVAAPLSEFAARRETRFEKLDKARRESFGGQGKELAKYRDERVKWEARPGDSGRTRPARPTQQESRNNHSTQQKTESDANDHKSSRAEPVGAQETPRDSSYARREARQGCRIHKK